MAGHLDPYVTLGVPVGASRTEAARAHRRLAKQFHPDLNPGPAAAERMRRINEAWRMLSDGSWAPPPRPTGAATTWTTWPESRGSAPPRVRRPYRPEPAEPSFGDRPAVLAIVWVVLAGLVFIGSWLGSLVR